MGPLQSSPMAMAAPDFYVEPAVMTTPGEHADLFAPLPSDVGELTWVCHGLLIHEHMTGMYGVMLSEEARREVQVRPIERRLGLLRAKDDRPLSIAREPAARQSADCRHYSVLIVAMLRSKGIPARARCGFGTYFGTGRAEDHWVAEYWQPDAGRWALVDAQVDEVQRNVFHPAFDLLDVPRDRFLVAGDAWTRCRRGEADPADYGLSMLGESGLWWIAANLIRDAAAVSNMEMLPWDCWGAMPEPTSVIPPADVELFDDLAALTHNPDSDFGEVRGLVASEPRLRVPDVIWNANLRQREPVF